MTSLATVLGLVPMALGLGEGAELQAPMARVVIGGLIASTHGHAGARAERLHPVRGRLAADCAGERRTRKLSRPTHTIMKKLIPILLLLAAAGGGAYYYYTHHAGR